MSYRWIDRLIAVLYIKDFQLTRHLNYSGLNYNYLLISSKSASNTYIINHVFFNMLYYIRERKG